MFRWLFKLILLIVLVALAYGIWLIYEEKTPEQKQAFRTRVSQNCKGISRTLSEAALKVVGKAQQLLQPEKDKQ